MTVRFSLTFEDRTAALLDQVGGDPRLGGKSRYLGCVAEQRWRAAQGTLAWLRDEGWELDALRTAMDALSATWEQGIGGCDAYQPMRTLRVAFPGSDIDERVCRALCLLAGEWWSYNQALRTALSDPPAKAPRKRGGKAVATA